jgi:hypothetical protein
MVTYDREEGAFPMSNGSNSGSADEMRVKYGFWLVLSGLVIMGIVFVVAILKWTAAADVAAAVGSLTGVVGTIVGAFFGVQAGASGKEKAEAARVIAENKAVHLAAELPPGAAQRVLSKF